MANCKKYIIQPPQRMSREIVICNRLCVGRIVTENLLLHLSVLLIFVNVYKNVILANICRNICMHISEISYEYVCMYVNIMPNETRKRRYSRSFFYLFY